MGSVGTQCAIGSDVTDCGYRYDDPRTACPRGSNITYFTAAASQHDVIVKHACQGTGTCGNVLQQWAASGSVLRAINPRWACAGGRTSCDSNLLDRRDGKLFYDLGTTQSRYSALRPEIEDAFRYKTRFVNRQGSSLGFTPAVCAPLTTDTPYCYDPDAIEELRDRNDCLQAIFRDYYASPTGPSNAELFTYLEEEFGRRAEPSPLGGLPTYKDGFERLNAELLIMLGDDAYTSAFESRFDLAGARTAGFSGDKFEDGGISVSGIAGFEMFKLHQATQYYQLAIDRFYRMSSVISAALASGSPSSARNFLSADTVTSYYDRLIRASTQSSRAWAEIAKRYQSFNRPDLARRVAIRAYTATYLESIALTNIILRMYDISGGTNRPQLLTSLDEAQRRYKMALLDLATVYKSLTDQVNFFGFAPDYVPFPALGTAGSNADINAFDYLSQVAQNKLARAQADEQVALAQRREFDTDAASFQGELSQLSRTYEDQLGDICGLFTAADARVYPAIDRYAYLDSRLSLYGDPCGFVDNGGIHDAILQADIARIEVDRLVNQIEAVHKKVRIQTDRASASCKQQLKMSDYTYKVGREEFHLDQEIASSQNRMDIAQRISGAVNTVAGLIACSPETCAQAAVAAGIVTVASGAEVGLAIAEMGKQSDLRAKRNEIDLASARWQTQAQCDLALIDLNAETATMLLDVEDLQIALIGAQYQVALALSSISKLRQQAKRIQLEQKEALELAVNTEASKNDPNVRIYKNDAVVNADASFEDALREAYRLTLVYEYYTSTTYAQRDRLFLTRMVASGDYNLASYVANIRNAFADFEETFGNADTRVLVVSLRDDILAIPRIAEDGTPLNNNERATLMRAQVLDPNRLNSSGYITLPFATRSEELSPLTRNHKVLFVEANIEGNDNGDYLGRLYLRQVGTSTVHSVNDTSLYYKFDSRTAVINPFFSGTREFASAPEVYRNYRLRDRPLLNNDWELVINQRDEAVNQDIKLNALTDIKLYVYYTDFTVY